MADFDPKTVDTDQWLHVEGVKKLDPKLPKWKIDTLKAKNIKAIQEYLEKEQEKAAEQEKLKQIEEEKTRKAKELEDKLAAVPAWKRPMVKAKLLKEMEVQENGTASSPGSTPTTTPTSPSVTSSTSVTTPAPIQKVNPENKSEAADATKKSTPSVEKVMEVVSSPTQESEHAPEPLSETVACSAQEPLLEIGSETEREADRALGPTAAAVEPEVVTDPAPEPTPEAASDPTAEAEPEVVADSAPEPTPAAESEPEVVADPAPEPTPGAASDLAAEAEPEVVTDPAPESTPATEGEPEVVADPAPEPTSETGAETEIVADFAPEPTPAAESEPEVVADPALEPTPGAASDLAAESEPEVVANPAPEPTSEPASVPAAEAEPEVVTDSAPESTPAAEAAPGAVADPSPEPIPNPASDPVAEAEIITTIESTANPSTGQRLDTNPDQEQTATTDIKPENTTETASVFSCEACAKRLSINFSDAATQTETESSTGEPASISGDPGRSEESEKVTSQITQGNPSCADIKPSVQSCSQPQALDEGDESTNQSEIDPQTSEMNKIAVSLPEVTPLPIEQMEDPKQDIELAIGEPATQEIPPAASEPGDQPTVDSETLEESAEQPEACETAKQIEENGSVLVELPFEDSPVNTNQQPADSTSDQSMDANLAGHVPSQ